MRDFLEKIDRIKGQFKIIFPVLSNNVCAKEKSVPDVDTLSVKEHTHAWMFLNGACHVDPSGRIQ